MKSILSVIFPLFGAFLTNTLILIPFVIFGYSIVIACLLIVLVGIILAQIKNRPWLSSLGIYMVVIVCAVVFQELVFGGLISVI